MTDVRHPASVTCFNTTLVQLKGIIRPKTSTLAIVFQNHTGPIKSLLNLADASPVAILRFNTTLVQLKEEADGFSRQ